MAHLAIYGNGYLGEVPRAAARSSSSGCCTPSGSGPSSSGGQLRFRYSPAAPGRSSCSPTADVVHVRGLSRRRPRSASRRSRRPRRVLGLCDELVKHALALLRHGDDGAPRARRRAAARRRTPRRPAPGARTTKGSAHEARPHGILVDRAATPSTSPIAQQARRRAVRRAAPPRRPGDRAGLPDPAAHAGAGTERRLASRTRTVEQDSRSTSSGTRSTPWLRRIELAITNDRDLAFQRQFVRFEVDGLLRADAHDPRRGLRPRARSDLRAG